MKINDGAIIFIRTHHQLVANLCLVIGVCLTVVSLIFTYRSLNQSADSVKQQLVEQKKATSVLIVSDFFTQVGDHIMTLRDGRNVTQTELLASSPEFRRLITTRSKLLIETLGFPDLTGQVVRFLGTNGFGSLFQPREGQPFIQLARLSLMKANLADVELSGPHFLCVDMALAHITNAQMDSANFAHANMQGANLTGAALNNANLQWVDLSHGVVSGLELKDATVAFSDLRGISKATTEATKGSFSAEQIASALATVKSLYGSLLDDDVTDALRKLLRERNGLRFEDLTQDPHVLITGRKGSDPNFVSLYENYRQHVQAIRRGWYDAWAAMQAQRCT